MIKKLTLKKLISHLKMKVQNLNKVAQMKFLKTLILLVVNNINNLQMKMISQFKIFKNLIQNKN